MFRTVAPARTRWADYLIDLVRLKPKALLYHLQKSGIQPSAAHT